jgi:hypothetical protein
MKLRHGRVLEPLIAAPPMACLPSQPAESIGGPKKAASA